MGGGVRQQQCIETAPSPVVFPQKASHCPKLETIREDEDEELEEEGELNVEGLFNFLSVLLSKETGLMQLPKLSNLSVG